MFVSVCVCVCVCVVPFVWQDITNTRMMKYLSNSSQNQKLHVQNLSPTWHFDSVACIPRHFCCATSQKKSCRQLIDSIKNLSLHESIKTGIIFSLLDFTPLVLIMLSSDIRSKCHLTLWSKGTCSDSKYMSWWSRAFSQGSLQIRLWTLGIEPSI